MTEGGTYGGARSTFERTGNDPHFLVDAQGIYQGIDTDRSAYSLGHHGAVETNRSRAIQIETIGFSGSPKDLNALRNTARLCRWLEQQHGIPTVWPSGFPDPPTPAGGDPGGHNRDVENWQTKSGHYGHCHVPANSHWDPAYTATETHFVMGEPVTVNVQDISVLEALGYVENGRSWAWAGPVLHAMDVEIVDAANATVTLRSGAQSITVESREHPGRHFIPLAALAQLHWTVDWVPGGPAIRIHR